MMILIMQDEVDRFGQEDRHCGTWEDGMIIINFELTVLALVP